MPRRISKEEAEALLAAGKAREVPRRKVSAAEAEALLAQGATAKAPIDGGEVGARAAAELAAPSGPSWAESVAPREALGTALRSFGQGASFGFADEMAGALGALQEAKGRRGPVGVAASLLGGATGLNLLTGLEDYEGRQGDDDARALHKEKPLGEALLRRYVQERGAARSDVEAGRGENPKLAFGSELTGMASVPIARARPLTSVGARAGQYASQGAKVGALQSMGTASDDIITQEGFRPEGLLDMGGHAIVGGALGGALSGVMGTGIEVGAERWLRPLLVRMAERNALKAVTPTAGIANRLRRMLGNASEEQLDAFGRRVLDARVLRPLGTAAGAQRRASLALEGEGQAIGGVLREADELVERGVAPRFDPAEALAGATSGLEAEAARTPARAMEAPAVFRELAARIDPPAAPVVGPLQQGQFRSPPQTFGSAWQNKVDLQRGLKPDSLSGLGDDAYRSGVRGYTGNIYAQTERAVGPRQAQVLRDAAARYGPLAQIEDLLTEEVTRAAARKPIGLTELGAGQMGAQSGGIPGAGAAMAIAALLRGRTASTVATGADALSRVPLRNIATVGGPLAARYVAKNPTETERMRALAALLGQQSGTPETP